MPAEESTAPVPAGTALADLSCCALMGTVVQAGSGSGVVVATGRRAEFGRMALGLAEHQPETEFQLGLLYNEAVVDDGRADGRDDSPA